MREREAGEVRVCCGGISRGVTERANIDGKYNDVIAKYSRLTSE